MKSITTLSTNNAETIWNNLRSTLAALELKMEWVYDTDYINHINTYLITYCRNHPWNDFSIYEEETDEEQLEALHDLECTYIKIKLYHTFQKAFL